MGTTSVFRAIFNTKHAFHGKLTEMSEMASRHISLCVNNFPSDCGSCYNNKTGMPLKECIKQQKYHMIQGFLEKNQN
jgi:hypothetical protein